MTGGVLPQSGLFEEKMTASLAAALMEARARTLLLIAGIPEDDLRRQHDPLMGPMLWDLGHIAHFEELWLLENIAGDIQSGEMPGMFNPFENPRAVRGELELPDLESTVRHMAETRARVLQLMRYADFGGSNELLRDGYVYRMVVQHEQQHNETMLQTLQLKQGEPYRPPRAVRFPRRTHASHAPHAPHASHEKTSHENDMVRFAGGRVVLGTDDRSAAYDNERPAHELSVQAFWIDRTAVSNADYLSFMEAGGYRNRSYWSEAGWAWLQESGATSPKYWQHDDGEWRIRHYDEVHSADNDAPVCHVSWYEAEAYATYRGKRLPTEVEWETAATWDPDTQTKRVYPWGDDEPGALHANVDQLAFAPAPNDTFELNVSPIGCYGMIGDTWEWTSSDFTPYPGYRTFPYPEYSEVFFGSDYKVLRGGSWATRPGSVRGTFRNWDYPIRRQIFSGFRCARDE
jgi:iron(II)-dependent oxidoreductase